MHTPLPQRLARYLPCLEWARQYDRATAGKDALAALIVTLMLIPQSLAYAMLAGLPPVAGLYASILPLFAYALLGTSRTLSVGPMALTSLMTAAAVGPLLPAGSAEYAGAVLLLTLLSGLILLLMAVLRLGFLANFLSHPVISGFNSASSLVIALGQLGPLLGIKVEGDNALALLRSLSAGLPHSHLPTVAIGTGSLVFLWLVRNRLHGVLLRLGFTANVAGPLTKAGPVVALLLAALAVHLLALDRAGVRMVGHVPGELPGFHLPPLDLALATRLLPSALLLSLVGFVGSVSVAQTLAAKRRQRIEPNQELVALSGANLVAALSGGLPVTGGMSRSVVNFDAGAQTPLASALTALGITVSVLFLTPLLQYLPLAVLAATIIVAVLTLFDLDAFRRTWRYSRQDAAAMLATMLGVLLVGVETGILLGVGLSLLLFLWRTSHPHIAVVGQLPGSEHFRNVERFAVVESPKVLSVRVDESLYFPNARYLEDRIAALAGQHPQAEHLVLMCSGVNLIDASALESLEAIGLRLRDAGIQLHLSEIKGPVMDRLRHTDFLATFGGQVFISQFEALAELDPQTTLRTVGQRRSGPAGTVIPFPIPSQEHSDEKRP